AWVLRNPVVDGGLEHGPGGRGGGHRDHVRDVRQFRVLQRRDQHGGGDDWHLEFGVQVRVADRGGGGGGGRPGGHRRGGGGRPAWGVVGRGRPGGGGGGVFDGGARPAVAAAADGG